LVKTRQKILAVDKSSSFLALVKEIANAEYDVEFQGVNSPEEGMKCLNNGFSPALIWSESKLDDFGSGDKDFLQSCKKISPLSSRILCATNFSENELGSMVREGEIHSYYIKPMMYEVGPILSAIKIGVEFHNVNIIENFLERMESDSFSEPEKIQEEYLNIEAQLGWADGTTRDWIDFEKRNIELNQLSLKTQGVFDLIPATVTSLGLLTNRSDATKIKKQIHSQMGLISGFLAHSKEYLESSMSQAIKADTLIAEVEAEIKKFKDEFLDG
jgi:hypothetical protein